MPYLLRCRTVVGCPKRKYWATYCLKQAITKKNFFGETKVFYVNWKFQWYLEVEATIL